MEKLERAANQIQTILKFEAEKLVRQEELGSEFAFKNAPSMYRTIQTYLEPFDGTAIRYLDDDSYNHIDTVFNRVNGIVSEISAFSGVGADSIQKRKAILARLADVENLVKKNLMSARAFCSSWKRKEETEELHANLKRELGRVPAQLSSLQKEMKQVLSEAKSSLLTVKEIAEESGISQQSFFFKEEADSCGREIRRWGVITVLVFLLVMAGSVGSYFLAKEENWKPESTFELVQLVVSKTVVLSALLYLLFFSVRNFLSAKHNRVVNRHRQNALLTYQALTGVMEKDRETVLIAAASCIYSPQPTGLTKAVGASSSSVPLLGLLAKGARGDES